jgi:hypothetical protein
MATDAPENLPATAGTLNEYLHELLNLDLDEKALLDRAVQAPRELVEAALRGLIADRLRMARAERRRANGLLGGPDAAQRAHPAVAGVVHSGRSSRVAAIRNNAEKLEAWFSDAIWIGTCRRKLGDASYVDLSVAAALLRRSADNLTGKAERLEKLAALVDEYEVTSVRALPVEALLGLVDQA